MREEDLHSQTSSGFPWLDFLQLNFTTYSKLEMQLYFLTSAVFSGATLLPSFHLGSTSLKRHGSICGGEKM